MRLSIYLRSQKWLILTYVLLMIFFVIVTLLDPVAPMHITSLLYIEGIALILLVVYCGFDFYKKKTFYGELGKRSESDKYINFPEATNDENELIIQFLKNQQDRHLKSIEYIQIERKEWQEYMTSWFHEIKTPIAVSRMIYETGGNLKSLEEEMDKIEHFIEQALYFSRLNDFHKDYLIQEIDIERIVKEAVKMHTKTFLAKKISLQLKMDEFEVLTDKKGLLFIINQILSNSLKYTDNNGTIAITIERNKRMLTVKDSGIGIDSSDIPRIFEKGFTGKNGRQLHSSTGMGLYLAKKTAEKLGHAVTITSEKDRFTEAIIYFPETEDQLYQIEN